MKTVEKIDTDDARRCLFSGFCCPPSNSAVGEAVPHVAASTCNCQGGELTELLLQRPRKSGRCDTWPVCCRPAKWKPTRRKLPNDLPNRIELDASFGLQNRSPIAIIPLLAALCPVQLRFRKLQYVVLESPFQPPVYWLGLWACAVVKPAIEVVCPGRGRTESGEKRGARIG